MMWDGGGWAWMFLGPLMMILFVAAVVILAALALRWSASRGAHPGARRPAGHAGTALDILEKRYARGEVDEAELEERRRVLGE